MLKQSFLTNLLIIWFLLALLNDLEGLGQVDGNSVLHLVNGTLGQSLMLSLHLPWADPSMVTWDFRNSSTGRKIQVCLKVRNSPADCNNELGQRINLNLTDYSLEIQALMKSDQGFYEVNARSGQSVYEEIIELRVYERVSNLSIQIKDVSSNGTCHVSLSCSVENNSNLKYSWWRGSEVVTTSGSHSVTDNGMTLEMSLNRHEAKTVYNCTVKNPVSEETGSIDLAGPCNITEKDHKLQNKTQLHIGIAVAVITILSVILIATLFVWRKKQLKPNEAPNIEGTSEPAQYAIITRTSNTRVQSQGHLCQLDASERKQSRGVQLTTIYDEIKFNADVSTPMMTVQKGQEASANA